MAALHVYRCNNMKIVVSAWWKDIPGKFYFIGFGKVASVMIGKKRHIYDSR